MRILASHLLSFILGVSPALAEVETCRFIQGKPEREACYARQEAALAAKRKAEATAGSARDADTSYIELLQQMRREDAEVNRSMHSICRGC